MIKTFYDSYIHIDIADGEQWSELAIRILQQVDNEGVLRPRIVSFNGKNSFFYGWLG